MPRSNATFHYHQPRPPIGHNNHHKPLALIETTTNPPPPPSLSKKKTITLMKLHSSKWLKQFETIRNKVTVGKFRSQLI